MNISDKNITNTEIDQFIASLDKPAAQLPSGCFDPFTLVIAALLFTIAVFEILIIRNVTFFC